MWQTSIPLQKHAELGTAGPRSPDGPRGYRGIVVHDPREDPQLGPQYRRPHRKALLVTNTKRQSLARESTVATTSSEKPGSAAPKEHTNPVAAAIDQPYIQATRRQTVRKPPRLPPAFEMQKAELENLEAALAVVRKQREAEQAVEASKFRLLFDDRMRAQVGEYRGHGLEALFEEPLGLNRPEPPTLSKEVSHSLHKSQWLSVMPPRGMERPFSGAVSRIRLLINERGTLADVREAASPMRASVNTRSDNLPESTDKDPRRARLSQTDKDTYHEEALVENHARNSTRRSTQEYSVGFADLPEPQHSTPPADRPSTRSSRASRYASREASTTVPNAPATLLPASPAPATPDNSQTLSRSTVRFLKKLTREGFDPAHMVPTAHNVDALLRITLMGTKWTLADEHDRGESSVTTASSGRRTTSRARKYNPEEYRRLMQAAVSDAIPATAAAAAAAPATPQTTTAGIELVLPNVREMKEEEDSVDGGEDGDEEPTTIGVAGPALDSADPLDFGAKFMQILSKSKKGAAVPTNFPLPAPVPPNEFSLVRLIILLKRVATERYKPKYGLAAADEGKSAGTAAGHAINDFLNTPYVALQSAPARGTPAHAALSKVLLLALCDESEDHALRFEAFRVFRLLEPVPNQLGRWEAVAFRRVLEEMLADGNGGDKWLAATTLAAQREITPVVLGLLLQSLGEVDARRRADAIRLIGGLGIEFADQVLSGIIICCGSLSWRVRQDAVVLLEQWIDKLAPAWAAEEQAAAKLRAAAAGSRRSTAQSSSERVSDDGTSRPTTRATEAATPAAPELSPLARLLQSCIEALLNLMWNDWSAEVRDSAAVSLGRLGKGRTILDWIFSLLGSPDPLRRIDALRSLTKLCVLQPSALDLYLRCLMDEFTSVRVEACKLACIVRASDRQILNALLDRFGDFAWQVRAYAVKAIGVLQNTDPQVHAAIRCALYHEPHVSVRAEAIEAALKLGILVQDKELQEAVFTLMETDPSTAIRKEAEKALVATGLIAPLAAVLDAAAGGGGDALDPAMERSASASVVAVAAAAAAAAAAVSAPGSARMIPYPHILANRTADEVDVFLRTSLVTEKELDDVMDQVRDMAGHDRVVQEVAEIPGEEEDEDGVDGLDDHMPDLKSIHGKKPRPRVDVGLPDIVRKLPGVPFQRPWQHHSPQSPHQPQAVK
ncbi:HEAT repeat-containing protein 4 [Geranomyces variabilis]|uniref:HEAT repeat-containing protein 4 n=1 Tax=Geranomyces variabilis TaxID=109894 RepID=A0AAD5XPL8_9FUNG|nr:HEAT repeat-containing protein 4 [Geranomyces variabilis]